MYIWGDNFVYKAFDFLVVVFNFRVAKAKMEVLSV